MNNRFFSVRWLALETYTRTIIETPKQQYWRTRTRTNTSRRKRKRRSLNRSRSRMILEYNCNYNLDNGVDWHSRGQTIVSARRIRVKVTVLERARKRIRMRITDRRTSAFFGLGLRLEGFADATTLFRSNLAFSLRTAAPSRLGYLRLSVPQGCGYPITYLTISAK